MSGDPVERKEIPSEVGHLAPSYVAESIRKHAPSFGFKPDKTVVELGR
jgi:hypothetical protein